MRRRQGTTTQTDRREEVKTIRRDKDLTQIRRSEGITTETDGEEDEKKLDKNRKKIGHIEKKRRDSDRQR